jgi:hypothetical protein
MKANYLCVLFVAAVLVSSCKNEIVKPQSQAVTAVKSDSTAINSTPTNPVQPPPGPDNIQVLVAKWNLVRDSVFNSMGNFPAARTSAYNGTPGDYFDFRTDGKCYTKEGNVYDTLNYSITTNHLVVLSKFGINVNGSYEPNIVPVLTDHAATIQTQFLATPDGFYLRYIYLKK